MRSYLKIEDNEKVEAVQWNGESAIFYDWERKYGKLPFTYLDFPRMRIQNTPSKTEFVFFASVGDWIVRTKDNIYVAYKDRVFKNLYKENNFFTLQ